MVFQDYIYINRRNKQKLNLFCDYVFETYNYTSKFEVRMIKEDKGYTTFVYAEPELFGKELSKIIGWLSIKWHKEKPSPKDTTLHNYFGEINNIFYNFDKIVKVS